MSLDAAIAATRFGLGARGTEIADPPADPRAALKAQLAASSAFDAGDLVSSAEALTTALAALRAPRRTPPETPPDDPTDDPRAKLAPVLDIYADEIAARTRFAATTTAGFRERLVRFWSNHFTVAAVKPPLLALAGAFEREAIRPHVAGRFADMLLAAESHPAMLIYLDNHISVGPATRVATRRNLGLNENLARETLELHTLGVDGGYSQADVEELAKAITGWTVGGRHVGRDRSGEFVFAAPMHEPGARRVLGRRYADGGVDQGRAILDDLARHPATARHVATKLARHFVADAPDAASVAALERVFLDTDGDLGAVSAAVVDLDAAWAPAQRKMKTSEEFLISAMRALAIPALPPRRLGGVFRALGQRPFAAPSPAGWPDDAAAWAGPDAIKKRLEWAAAVAARVGPRRPESFLDNALGDLASAATRQAVARAESGAQGLALALMSPEFQRR